MGIITELKYDNGKRCQKFDPYEPLEQILITRITTCLIKIIKTLRTEYL